MGLDSGCLLSDASFRVRHRQIFIPHSKTGGGYQQNLMHGVQVQACKGARQTRLFRSFSFCFVCFVGGSYWNLGRRASQARLAMTPLWKSSSALLCKRRVQERCAAVIGDWVLGNWGDGVSGRKEPQASRPRRTK